jgi:HAD superfamily hydrolase (TIGR01450 family)
LWLHLALIPGSSDAINRLIETNKRVFLYTNYSATTRDEMVKKCHKMGMTKVGIDNIITSTQVVAHHLKSSGFNRTAYVVGSPALGLELDNVGIQHTGIGADHLTTSLVDFYIKDFGLRNDSIGAVIVGFDEQFCYKKLIYTSNYLQDPNVEFYACSDDPFFKFPTFHHPESGELRNF